MRLALAVLIFFVAVYSATTENTENRQIHNYLPYYASNMVEHQRLLLRTTTVALVKMSTLTFTITCTKSTTACTSSTASTTPSSSPTSSSAATTSSSSTTAAGRRRRREIDNIEIEDEDWTNEQLSIVPSNVQGVESTQAPVREGRAAHPQLLAMMPPFGYYHPQEIQSGFDSDPTLALPYYESLVQPAVVSQPHVFFRGFFNGLFQGFVITKTETLTSVTIAVTTSTSSPACSAPGFLQCA